MGNTNSANRMESEKQEMIQQLRRTNDELNHFVRALSHDMRANFHLLDNSFSRLKQRLGERPSEDLIQSVAHVEACLRQSQRFLEDLVELGRSGSVQVEPCAVDLGRVVDEVLFEQRELLQQRGVEVIVERSLPTFWCNEGRLKQIVVNLLRNAVKHGCDRQSPRITIGSDTATGPDTDSRGGAARGVAFRVHDNGRGIDPRHHQAVFLPGWRLADADAEGSGMGLAIVKKIVDYYGGSVYIEPARAAGTTFVVVLPPAPVTAGNPTSAVGPALTPARHRPHAPQPHKKFVRRSSPAGRG
jgi:signal transduction histidine kinase